MYSIFNSVDFSTLEQEMHRFLDVFNPVLSLSNGVYSAL